MIDFLDSVIGRNSPHAGNILHYICGEHQMKSALIIISGFVLATWHLTSKVNNS